MHIIFCTSEKIKSNLISVDFLLRQYPTTIKIGRNNMGKNNKKRNHNTKKAPATESQNETLEFREKRINIVFKMLYVFAIACGALFLNIEPQFKQGVTDIYLVSCAFLSFTASVLIFILLYIVNEMKCLKSYKSVEISQKEKADNSYSKIFTGLGVSGISVALLFSVLFIIDACNDELFSKIENLQILLTGLFLVGIGAISLTARLNKKFKSASVLNIISITFTIFCAFLFMAVLT